jgi:molybdopterin-biosynthesis enzyme MoeA-like protein
VSLGAAPQQLQQENLHTTPFDALSRQRRRATLGLPLAKDDACTAQMPVKNLFFNNPIGLAPGFDKNAQVRTRSRR